MSDEPFSAEYFQHLLTSLTLNSRALIVELTGLAERYLDNAAEIVALVEERISKILPKYKLYSFYLMDSIIKNIGNPYNVLFANNLYKNFTETYLIVTDSPTRQNLINLFKTWLTGKTNLGADLFPHDVLAKMEQFIIKATSLTTGLALENRVTRDTLLREGNYLLQYVIAMDEDLEKYTSLQKLDSEHSATVLKWRLTRNNLIYEINAISETVMLLRKEDFEPRKEAFAASLRDIRQALDNQSGQQQELLRGVVQPLQLLDGSELADVMPTLDTQPKQIDVLMILGTDDPFEKYVAGWGKEQVQTSSVFAQPTFSLPVQPALPEKPTLAHSLGLSMASLDFLNSLLAQSDENNELSSSMSNDDGDGYDPEETLNDFDEGSPPTSPAPLPSGPFHGRSSLKRPSVAGDERVAKRVRFDV